MIDDESKKFIKETIENAIDDKLSERDKKTESQKKLDSINYQKKELEDRKKLLAELSERDKKGQATIAEKFEKLKLSVDTSIPQDLKDAWKTGSKGVQAGANQVGKGIGHLTARAMMSNPLTAFLYQNRDIAGAIGDIGIGSIKAGWGALKGIGHGALGLANSAKNLFNRDEEEETEEILNLPKPSFSENSQAEKLVKEKSNWEKQINEMHTIITQDLTKNQKKSSEIMGKGLKGLDDNMKAIKGFTDMMAAKQKLILGGIMLGAAAIVGLVAWFKSGGPAGVLNPKNNPETAENRTNNTVDVGNVANFTPDTTINITNQMVTPGTTTKKKEEQQANLWDWVKSPTESRKMAKKYNFSGATSDLLGESVHLAHGGLNGNIKTYQNEGNIKIAFPVAIKMLDVRFDETAEQGASALIEKAEVTRGVKERLRYASGTSPRLIVTNIKKLLIPKKEIIKANTTLFIVGKEYQLIGDVSAFMRGETYESYTNKNNKDSSVIDKNYIEQAKTDRFSKALVNSEKDYANQAAFQQAFEETHPILTGIGKVTDNILDKAAEASVKQDNKIEGQTTGQAAPVVSTNIKKAQEQNKKLNEKKEEPKIEQGTPQGQGYVGQLPNLNIQTKDKTTAYRTADKVTTSELADMSPNTTVNIAAVNN